MEPNYWVVGASFEGGQADQFETFFRRGYWFMGWDDDKQPVMAERRNQIRPGDRIAIKKMLGQGSSDIEIRAIGVVTEIDQEEKRVYVRWAARDLDREVPGNGCFATVHGPFEADDEWTRLVFQL
jgi:hypothetical protein